MTEPLLFAVTVFVAVLGAWILGAVVWAALHEHGRNGAQGNG